MLENIVTVKSFTPDKPGNFTGGAVNIGTRSFPDAFTLSISASTTFNTQSSFESGFLTYDGRSYDWLGMDDGTRQVPDQLVDEGVEIPDIGTRPAFRVVLADHGARDAAPSSATATRLPSATRSPCSGSPSDSWEASAYSRKLAHYDGGNSGRWQFTGSVESVEGLTNNFLLDDTRSAEEVLWGSLLSATYRFRPSGGASARVTPWKRSPRTTGLLNIWWQTATKSSIRS